MTPMWATKSCLNEGPVPEDRQFSGVSTQVHTLGSLNEGPVPEDRQSAGTLRNCGWFVTPQ